MRKLRSQEWYGRQDRDGFVYRSWMKSEGYPHDLFDGRPIIGICNTWSELTPCNSHFRDLAEWVKMKPAHVRADLGDLADELVPDHERHGDRPL
ncbi:MAG TPA: hypothetical protein VFW94_13355, partial [Candidatus Acidoferrales bacterium]|nr:hypothetical protein [Candidatus Acidoferrales bacterium]